MSQINTVINRRCSYQSSISLGISVFHDHQNTSCSWNVGKTTGEPCTCPTSFKFRKLLLHKATYFFSLSFCGSFLQLVLWWTALGRTRLTPHRPHLLCWMFIASKTQTAFIGSPKPALETKERRVLCEPQHPHEPAGLPPALYRAVRSLKHLLYSELQQMRMLWETVMLTESIL